MATITVDTVTDEQDGSIVDGDISLRDAIDAAMAGDTIEFDAALDGQTIALTMGQLAITNDLIVDGDRDDDYVPDVTLSGNNASRLFNIDAAATVTLQGLNLIDGSFGPALDGGGAILTAGNLTVIDSTLSGHYARGSGGAINNSGTGTLTLYNSAIYDSSGGSGGAIRSGNGGSIVVTNSVLSGNEANRGAGIFSSDPVTLTNSTISGNSAQMTGGGIDSNSALTITNSVIWNNRDSTGTDTASASIDVGGSLARSFSLIQGFDDSGTGNLDGVANAGDANFPVFLMPNDPALAPAAGGDLRLGNTSPALDVGNNAALDEATVGVDLNGDGDQVDTIGQDRLGDARIQNGTVTLGAFETPLLTALTVDTLTDENDGIGFNGVSLRDAIAAIADGGTIDFGGLTGTLTLTVGELAITKSLTITGPGDDSLTIDADGNSRIFNIDDSDGGTDRSVAISGLTLTNGFAAPGDQNGDGGGIINDEDLTLTGVTISVNNAAADGGAIDNTGVLTVRDSTLSDNLASSEGGAIYTGSSSLTRIENTAILNNLSLDDGGGVRSRNDLALVNVTLAENFAGDGGGGLYTSGTSTLLNVTVSGNTASGRGGGWYNDDVAVAVNSTFSGNSGGEGGGIYNFTGDTLSLGNSIVLGNRLTGGTASEIEGNGTLNEDGPNIIGTADAAAADVFDQVDGNGAGVLADNGGPTQTIALNATGAAVNAGTNAAAIDAAISIDESVFGVDLNDDGDTDDVLARVDELAFDQRGTGFERVIAGTIDLGAVEAQSATGPMSLTVDTLADEDDGINVGGVSLRDAIAAVADGGTIDFGGLTGTLTLTQGELAITKSLTITGPGAASLTVSGDADSSGDVSAGDSRIFSIDDGNGTPDKTVAISGLTLSGGYAGGPFPEDRGGAIVNAESLTLTDSVVANNTALNDGGGIFQFDGAITLSNTRLSGNTANSDGGGLFIRDGSANLDGVTVSDNSALYSNGDGGGVYIDDGILTISGSSITNNDADRTGGGVYVRDGSATIVGTTISGNSTIVQDGGGIGSRGSLSLVNATVSDNTAFDNGGGIYIGTGTATIVNVTISGNYSGDRGGGIFNGKDTVLVGTTISGNEAGIEAGGIGTEAADTTILANSIVLGNRLADDTESETGGAGTLSENGPNIIGTADAAATDVFAGVDANGAGVPANNGGPTATIALKPDAANPALDAGDEAVVLNLDETVLGVDINGDGDSMDLIATVADLAFDQRGPHFDRVIGTAVDLGAYEAQPEALAPPASLTVDLLTDVDDGDTSPGNVSLREAIRLVADGGTVDFALPAGATLMLTQGEIAITKSLTITGPGADLFTIDADGKSRVFNIDDGDGGTDSTVAISGLTITNGSISGLGADSDGGGILNRESLTLTDTTISGNYAENGGGGLYADGGAVSLSAVTISNNVAGDNGGGIYAEEGSLTIEASTISGNSAADYGGGIYSDVATTIKSAIISGNQAGEGGGGIYHNDSVKPLTLINTTVSGNTATEDGGGVGTNGPTTLINSTVSGNDAQEDGGGIFINRPSFTAVNTTISGNYAAMNGGAVFNGGTVFKNYAYFINTTISGNTSGISAGGIYSGETFDSNPHVTYARNSILLGNRLADDTASEYSGNGMLVEDGPNIIGTADGAAADIFAAVDGNGAGVPADNGGPTATIALEPDAANPALDAGDEAVVLNLDETVLGVDINGDGDSDDVIATVADLAFDQRGPQFDRVIGTAVDLGAYEAQPEAFEPPPASLTVDLLSDVDDGDISPGNVSLREAIRLVAPGGSIDFGSLSGTLMLTQGEIAITKSLTIIGPGENLLTIDAGGNSRIFNIDDGDGTPDETVAISGLTLTDGFVDAPGFGDRGGGIYAEESLTLSNVTVSDSHAGNDGGAIALFGDGNGTLVNVTLENNYAGGEGGAINSDDGNLTVIGSTISQNTAKFDGGAIYSRDGTVTVIGSTISGNKTVDDGGGGGGLYIDGSSTGFLYLINSTISDNTAPMEEGGGLYLRGTGTIINSTFSGNESGEDGGAIINNRTLALFNSTVSGNVAGTGYAGGGIFTYSGDTTTVTNSIVLGNRLADDTDSEIGGPGTLVRDGANIIGTDIFDDDTDTGDTTAADVFATVDGNGAGVLADIGGPTETIALKANSGTNPAVNGGDNAVAINLVEADFGFDLNDDGDLNDTITRPDEIAFDQRGDGFDRVVGNDIDLGAVEVQPPPPPPPPPPPADDDLFDGDDQSDIDNEVETGLEPTDDFEDTEIDGAPATTGSTTDSRTGETVEVIVTNPSQPGERDDEDPTTPDVDVPVGDDVRVSKPETLGLIATVRITTDQDNLSTIIGGGTDNGENAEDAAERQAFLDQVLPDDPEAPPVNVVQIIPARPSAVPDDEPVSLSVTLGDGDADGDGVDDDGRETVTVIDVTNLLGPDGELTGPVTITVNGDGPVVIIGAGNFIGGTEELDDDDIPDIDIVRGDGSPQVLFFGPGPDTVYGGGGDDRVSSAGGIDLLFGGTGNDTIDGGADDDVLTGGKDDDLIHGGAGSDSAAFDGAAADFAVTSSVFGWRVADAREAGTLGRDTLVSVESLEFNDGSEAVAARAANGFTLFAVANSSLGQQSLLPGSEVRLVDAPGAQTYDVPLGAALGLSGVSGANTVNLEGDAADYMVLADGTRFVLVGPEGGGLALVPDTAPQTLVFGDGALELSIEAGSMLLGGEAVPGALSPIAATPDGATNSAGLFDGPVDGDAGPSSGPNLFGIAVEGAPATLLRAGTQAKLIDAPGPDAYHIAEGAGLSLSGVAGENVFRFQQASSEFTAALEGSTLVLTAADGAETRLPGDIDTQTLVFADGTAAMTISGDQLRLGDAPVGSAPTSIAGTLDPVQTSEAAFGPDWLL